MRKFRALIKLSIFSFVIIHLVACNASGGSSNTPKLSVSTNELNIGVITNSGQAPDQTISGTVSDYSGPLYIYITHTNNGISAISDPILSGNTGTSTISMLFKTQGVYLDTIVVQACPDPYCDTQLAGSPQIINVVYTVGISVNPPNLSFSAPAGSAPPTQTVMVYYNDNNLSGSNWSSSYLYLDGSGWMSYTPADGQGQTQVDITLNSFPIGTSPGIYNAEIRFGANAGMTTFTLPIQYTIN